MEELSDVLAKAKTPAALQGIDFAHFHARVRPCCAGTPLETALHDECRVRSGRPGPLGPGLPLFFSWRRSPPIPVLASHSVSPCAGQCGFVQLLWAT